MPRDRAPGCHAVDRRVSGCPLVVCEPWMWAAIQTWNDWSTFRALPNEGPLSNQPARLLSALSIIESESHLVRAYEQEIQMRRANRRGR